jgi:hypothetical protein
VRVTRRSLRWGRRVGGHTEHGDRSAAFRQGEVENWLTEGAIYKCHGLRPWLRVVKKTLVKFWRAGHKDRPGDPVGDGKVKRFGG